MTTTGERTFIQYCLTNGLKYENIPETKNNRTPDYKLYLRNDFFVIVEVKDLEENPEEIDAIRNLDDNGFAVWGNSNASKIKHKIDDGKGQLKNFVMESVPAILLLYDNREQCVGGISSDEIAVGMYGVETHVRVGNRILKRHGMNKKLTEKVTTYISYIGIIRSNKAIDLYENYYSVNKIDVNAFRDLECFKVFRLKCNPNDCFAEWERIL
jgi:hypothetical protein